MDCKCNGKCAQGSIENKFNLIDHIIESYKDQKGSLIPILHQIQKLLGYLPEDVQAYVAKKLEIPLSEVYGVVTFYTLFTTQQKGKYNINICLGTACYVKGSGKILSEFEKQLKIKVGETTEDGMFTLDACRCLGACGLAPVLVVNDKVHGRLTVDNVASIIEKYREE
ncbi:MAG: NADH-quinone oxidoreductase subunit NuoE [Clostridia bacterium]|nr:NADH-quinone oxidoreductase subunit NuoE [Clostridia bacterium]MDD4048584.1 NADH-quinone oxidoreductase subunit NuoE [Clostridia bacterium]